ncbi:MAG: hypothetical protein ABIK09_17670 [Pseudomonadota bacterium]
MINDAAREDRFCRESVGGSFRFRCAHCVHVVQGRGTCSMAYPNHMMCTPDLRCRDDAGRWIFCKCFELDGT